jgi:hypothetical protein
VKKAKIDNLDYEREAKTIFTKNNIEDDDFFVIDE